jgi:tetratricopeptide (TPR) repeat protein
MKRTIGKDEGREAAIYFLMALFASGVLFYLHFFDPATYVRFITEDQWGEYATFVYFALGGILLLVLAWRQSSSSRKYIWALAGIFTLIIGAEEVSWGQRILNLPIPSALRQLNSQGELSLHNVGYLDDLNRGGLHRGAGLLILGWCLCSGLLALFAPRSAKKMEESGLPLIPIRLLPFFLLVPFFFLGRPLIKSDEIGEIFLGIAAAAWALHLFLRYSRTLNHQRKNGALFILGFFALGSGLTMALTSAFPGSLTTRLNQIAERDYPAFGMYDQAERLFEYIYANPQHLLPQTRINHGRMLIERGVEERGFQVLMVELERLSGPEPEERDGDFLRRKGTIHSMLGQWEYAEEDFRQALEIEVAQVESSTDPDQKAERLWSVARTFAASGRSFEALETAQQARETAVSERLRGKVERWILWQSAPSNEEEGTGGTL